MKGFTGLFIKDFKVAYRNFFFLIVLIVALLLVGVTNFLIPEKINTDSAILYTVETEAIEHAQIISILARQEGNFMVPSREDLLDLLKKDRESIGVILKSSNGKPSFEIVFQGYENEQSRSAIILTFESLLNANSFDTSSIDTVILKNTDGFNSLPFNKGMIPLMILNEPVMLGFIFLATMIFMEKEAGTTNAYMTTPGGIGAFLFSKVLLMALLALISTVLITVFTVGFNVNWSNLIFITIVGSFFGSSVALVLSSFFDNISKAMVWILAISLIFTAPMLSYFAPSFAPKYITAMPTYSLMFAIREAMFPVGNSAVIYESAIYLTVLSLILFGASLILYKRSMVLE